MDEVCSSSLATSTVATLSTSVGNVVAVCQTSALGYYQWRLQLADRGVLLSSAYDAVPTTGGFSMLSFSLQISDAIALAGETSGICTSSCTKVIAQDGSVSCASRECEPVGVEDVLFEANLLTSLTNACPSSSARSPCDPPDPEETCKESGYFDEAKAACVSLLGTTRYSSCLLDCCITNASSTCADPTIDVPDPPPSPPPMHPPPSATKTCMSWGDPHIGVHSLSPFWI